MTSQNIGRKTQQSGLSNDSFGWTTFTPSYIQEFGVGSFGPLPPYRFLFSKYWQIWSQTPSKQEITQVLGLKKKKRLIF